MLQLLTTAAHASCSLLYRDKTAPHRLLCSRQRAPELPHCGHLSSQKLKLAEAGALILQRRRMKVRRERLFVQRSHALTMKAMSIRLVGWLGSQPRRHPHHDRNSLLKPRSSPRLANTRFPPLARACSGR